MTAPNHGPAVGAGHSREEAVSLGLAVLCVSDSRTLSTDRSGAYLAEAAQAAGHQLVDRQVCADDVYQIRARLSAWIADPAVHCVLVTGGTGFRDRDVTPEAVAPLLDRTIDGFGELFRLRSHEEIGSSTLQSRALGGVANRTLVFCLPGSTGACRTGWQKVLAEQLDSTHQPCNFVEILDV